MHKKHLLTLCAAALGMAVACGKTESPVSPSASVAGTNALPDGSTLKINAPRITTPTNNVQISRGSPFVVTLENVNGLFATFPVSYQLEIRNGNSLVATYRFNAAQGPT